MFFGLQILFTYFAWTAAAGGTLTQLVCLPVLTAAAYTPDQIANYKAYEDTPLKDIPFLGVKDLAPTLEQDLATIANGFRTSSASAMGHILTGNIYEDWTSKSHKLNGGMHTLAGRWVLSRKNWQDVGFSILADKNFSNIEQYHSQIEADPKSRQFVEMKALNLDPHKLEDFYLYILAGDRSHYGPLISDTGVVHYKFGKNVFNSKKWKESVAGAGVGRAPAGAKTLFPAMWSEAKIQAAILHVLTDQKTRILSLQPKPDLSGIKSILLEGQYEGVYIAVAIAGGQVNSAYPSWAQNRSATPREIYREVRYHADRMFAHTWTMSENMNSRSLGKLEDIVGYYVGKSPDPAPPNDNLWHLYLNPALRPNGRKHELEMTGKGPSKEERLFGLGTSVQHHTEEFLLHWRLREDAKTNISP